MPAAVRADRVGRAHPRARRRDPYRPGLRPALTLGRLVAYHELDRLTRALTAGADWPGPPVRVLPLRDRRYWARAWPRTVRYGPRAPVWVVAHELAHVASGDFGHGDAWRAWMVTLCGRLATVVEDEASPRA